LSGLLGSSQLASQTASQGFRPLPSVWARICFQSIPVCMLLAFALPILMGALSLRRRLPAPDRLLTCFRLPLFLRGTASLVAFTMLLTSLPFNTLAQEADLYTQLETSNWGRGGTVTQYEYDDNGSLTLKTVTGGSESLVESYTYDLQNRLASHVRTDSDETGTTVTTTAYRYSPSGGKVGQATTVVMNGVLRPELSETTNYLLDFSNSTGYSQILEETDGAGTLLKSYTIGDDVLSQSVHATIVDPQLPNGAATYQQDSYFLYDGHGSTRQLASSQGSVTAQYAYDSYGVMLGQTSGAQQRQATSLLYSGEQFDSTLQQYHLRARNYNQANGQFTTLDPYAGNIYDPQSLHKYAYCHTDPVNGVDPSGMTMSMTEQLMVSSVILTITSMIIPAITGAIVAGNSNVKFFDLAREFCSEETWKEALIGIGLGALIGEGVGAIAKRLSARMTPWFFFAMAVVGFEESIRLSWEMANAKVPQREVAHYFAVLTASMILLSLIGQARNGTDAAETSGRVLTDAESKLYGRVSHPKGFHEEVWERAKAPDGNVYDPNGRIMKFDEPWELGHIPDHKFTEAQILAAEEEWTRHRWIRYQNDSDIYRPELPSSNAGHKWELPEIEWFK
jgi:RHS repeat-associated protein